MNSNLTKDAKYLQRILNFAGYNCGAVDGIIGKKTVAAIEMWDKDEKAAAKEYGLFDERTERNLSTLLPICQRYIRAWIKDKVSFWASQNSVEIKITRWYN